MAGKSEAQRTVSFRLNMAREDERELYEAIIKHNRGKKDDPYGSSGAYIKAALRSYHGKERDLQQQEQFREEMQAYIHSLSNKQRELFLSALDMHDQKLITTIVESVVSALAGPTLMSGVVQTMGKVAINSGDTPIKDPVGETMPEEALSYLESL